MLEIRRFEMFLCLHAGWDLVRFWCPRGGFGEVDGFLTVSGGQICDLLVICLYVLRSLVL